MKTNLRLLIISILLVGFSSVYFASCKKAAEAAAYTCTTSGTGCSAFKACVDKAGTSGYYEYNGTKYNFTNGNYTQAATDCANAIIAACYKKSPQDLNGTIQQILDQTAIVQEENRYNK